MSLVAFVLAARNGKEQIELSRFNEASFECIAFMSEPTHQPLRWVESVS